MIKWSEDDALCAFETKQASTVELAEQSTLTLRSHPENERITVRRGAQLTLYHIPQPAQIPLQIILEQDAQLHCVVLTMHESNTATHLKVTLSERGADAKLTGLIIAGVDQTCSYRCLVTHQNPYTSSTQHYRAVAFEGAKAEVASKIYVAQGAEQTDAQLTQKHLLLSDSAQAGSQPELEIYADQVQCTHGATVGQLDPNQQFYLQSRGLVREEARALLTYAFLGEMIERIPHPAVRDLVGHSIKSTLGVVS